MTHDAFIIEAARTAVGRRNGMLAHWHPVDLLAATIEELVRRAGVDSAAIDDVIVGCVDQVGEQSLNVGRSAALAAGLPESVPGVTVDRQCGSSQQAVQFAAQGVLAGGYEVVIAAGVESMSRVPMFANVPNHGDAYGGRFRERYGLGVDELIEQGESGEILADRWGISREELDALALSSHERAAAAADAGRFDAEIVPVADADGSGTVTADEGVRRDTSPEALAGLRPVFRPDGRLTAGNSSQISDGAAALLIASGAAVDRLGLAPRARVHATALAGVDPVEMLSGPIPVTAKVLARAGLDVDDIDLFEINEAFASVPIAWLRETAADPERLNVNGGAIALGHPLGCSGARLMTTLVHELERRGGRFGLQAMCEGGGMANATILERCP
jgi:acetyl-CoA acetyltransferase family protein